MKVTHVILTRDDGTKLELTYDEARVARDADMPLAGDSVGGDPQL